ncbi:F-box and associated interaction domains-containing protein [Thalictrum thalictroides]|uniref:F-box and associated interaction domains-containing protein n=1 Tax=Thalictrum thalictroides TaxID=46969 RepID=A0A7J6VQ98_THATH|nr:F-box and associated interaction domains-containing protein [Thalictrum thalictroides]
MERLTPDLIMDVFSRLPLIFLIRVRCVSKSWHTIASGAILSTLRIQRSLTANNLTDAIVLTYPINSLGYQLYFVEGEPNYPIVKKIDLSFIHRTGQSLLSVVGVCNGILCFTSFPLFHGLRGINSIDSLKYICLLNPITGEHKQLPTFDRPSCSMSNVACLCCFGFDDSHRVFKVAIFMFHGGNSINVASPAFDAYKDMTTEMYVYTLGSSNMWRKTVGDVPTMLYQNYANASNVFANGSLHWISATPVNSSEFKRHIVSFNLRYENFSIIKPPEVVVVESLVNCYALAVLENCLSWVDVKHEDFVDIWLRKSDNGVESWIKHFSIQNEHIAPHFYGIVHPIKVRENGDLLLLCNCRLVVYNAQTNTCEFIKSIEDSSWPNAVSAFPYVGSLISCLQ